MPLQYRGLLFHKQQDVTNSWRIIFVIIKNFPQFHLVRLFICMYVPVCMYVCMYIRDAQRIVWDNLWIASQTLDLSLIQPKEMCKAWITEQGKDCSEWPKLRSSQNID